LVAVVLKVPNLALLPEYVRALERGWSPDNLRGKAAADEALEQIACDPQGFLAAMDDPDGNGPPVKRVDGTTQPRLPGYHRWIWDDGFCGSIGFRWWGQGDGLPEWFPYGHIGYAVPEWRRGRGYATAALALVLHDARARGLTWVELTTAADNPASQAVVAKNGGQVWAREQGGAAHQGAEIIRWRIPL
jgi:predicted acetyltransferase